MNTPFTQQDVNVLQEQIQEQQRTQPSVLGEVSAEAGIEAVVESAGAIADIGLSAVQEASAEASSGLIEAGGELLAGVFELFG